MILNVKKPAGPTSRQIVNEIRRLVGEKKVGHGGTLDPFAEGVLIVGVGRQSTKKLKQILKGADKEYVATLRLGQTSPTGDPEGQITKTASREQLTQITKERLVMTFRKFVGEIEQTPPAHSAIKIRGIPAYQLARQGKPVALPKRKVIIKELKILKFQPPLVRFKAVVSSGTYIRALAADIGRALGVGAYLEKLTRTRVGNFRIEESQTLTELAKTLKKPAPRRND